MNTEIVYLGRDNCIDLILKADDVAVDLSAVTKIELYFNDLKISTDLTISPSPSPSGPSEGDPIHWAEDGYAVGEVRLFLGNQPIPVGGYQVPLIVYDPSNQNGIYWGEIPINVYADVVPVV